LVDAPVTAEEVETAFGAIAPIVLGFATGFGAGAGLDGSAHCIIKSEDFNRELTLWFHIDKIIIVFVKIG
jgi:hypothetical protein